MRHNIAQRNDFVVDRGIDAIHSQPPNTQLIMFRLGIIGAGRLGSFHADKAAAHAGVDFVAVMDPVEAARKSLADKHGVKACKTLDDLISRVDAVVIAAPTFLHTQLGLPCLQQGRHVLMEKPMCSSWSDAQRMVAAAKRANVVFQVGHVEEFNPAWQAAQSSLAEARDGIPVLIDAVRTSGYTFRSTDVGTVFDMMIHDIDLILSLIPSRVLAVDAVGFNVLGGPHEDTADVRLRFENGTVANLYSSRVAEKPERVMRITMSSQTTTIDFGARTATTRRPSDRVSQGEFAPDNISPADIAALAPTFMLEQFESVEIQNDAVDALSREMDDFVQSISTGAPSRVSGERALSAVAVAEMIVESIRRGMPLHFGHVGRKVA